MTEEGTGCMCVPVCVCARVGGCVCMCMCVCVVSQHAWFRHSVPAVEYQFPTRRPVFWQDVVDLSRPVSKS